LRREILQQFFGRPEAYAWDFIAEVIEDLGEFDTALVAFGSPSARRMDLLILVY
jgi:hypothetical protein